MYFIQGEEMENKTTYQNNTKFENFPSTNNNKNGENKMNNIDKTFFNDIFNLPKKYKVRNKDGSISIRRIKESDVIWNFKGKK